MKIHRQKIAVIGSGITGLSAAWALKDAHDVTLFEADARPGGHANTVTIDYGGAAIDVDTGFIVFNDDNYPNLVGLFDALMVPTRLTDMSFACAGGGLEWSSNFPQGVFAQKRNLVRPSFLGMLNDIRRFNAMAEADLTSGVVESLTLGAYLQLRKFSNAFRDRYLLPMGAAIWSTSSGAISDVPAESFLRFLSNHGLLKFNQPRWRTVIGGSRVYVEAIRAALGERLRLSTGIVGVRRMITGLEITTADGARERFDQVIFACHSDQALAALTDADAEEETFLRAIRYAPNTVSLHRDPALMPRRRNAWGSWNYVCEPSAPEAAYVSYWMNNLQAIDPARPLFVTLNGPDPDPALTFGKFQYAHPVFDTAALAAQRRFGRIQGRDGVWYAGAWLGFGFHEDGITSALRVARALGGEVPWDFVDHRIPGGPLDAPLPQAEAEQIMAHA